MSDGDRASYIRALAGLDGHQRRVFSRRFELGLSCEAISDELGGEDSVESLRAIVKDALAGLAESMTGTGQPATGLDDVLESLVDDGPADWARLATSTDPGARAVLSALRAIDSFSGENRPSTPPDGVDVDAVDWPGLEITSRLGAGAFGQVFRAWDPTLERAVALKLSHGTLASTRDQTRLQQEARHLAQLRHPNIVAVYGVEEHGGRLGIQMELIEGETLAQTMDNGRTLSSEEAASVGIKLCQALAAAAAKQIIHSDIKAQNVMRETGGRIVLMDFGAARFKPSGVADTTGAAAGTPLYMAPELFEGSAPTPSSDIFALGVLLFHLVTNRFPVEATSVAGIREQHARFQRILLRDLRPDVAPDLAWLGEPGLTAELAREQAYAYLSLVLGVAVWRLFPRQSQDGGERLTTSIMRWATISVAAVPVVLAVLPYRVYWAEFPVVETANLRWFVLGDTETSLLLYNPEGSTSGLKTLVVNRDVVTQTGTTAYLFLD